MVLNQLDMEVLFKYKVFVVNEIGDYFVDCNVNAVANSKDAVIKEINDICKPVYMRVCIDRVNTIKMWINNVKIFLREQIHRKSV